MSKKNSKASSETSSFQPKSNIMDTKNEILMVSDESIVYLSNDEEDEEKKTVANVKSKIPSKRSQRQSISSILLETTNFSKRKVTSENNTNEIKTDKLKKLKTNEPIKMSPFLEKLYKTTNQCSSKSIQPNQNTTKINLLENQEKKSSEKENFNTSQSDPNCKESMKYQALNPIEIHQTSVTCLKDENNNNFTQTEPLQIELLDSNSELELLFDEKVFNEINLDCLDIVFDENLFQPQILPNLSPIKTKESDNKQVCETTTYNQTKLLPKQDQIEEISQLELNDLKTKLKQMEAELNFYKKACEKQEAENIMKDAELFKSKKQIMKDKTLIDKMKLNYGKLIFIN